MRIAFVFPGQGSHRAGALAAWRGRAAWSVLEEVEAGVGRDVVALCDDPEAGARTADAQPAILAACLVAWRALVDAGVSPALVAGHSLGEVTAAVAAGSLSVRDGAALVAERGAAMGAACAANPGTMAAVVKLAPEAVERLVDEDPELVVANDNAPGQVVLAGTPEAVARVRERVREEGGRVVPLDVEGAFHSPAMVPAVERVAALLAALELREPQVPVVTGTTAEPLGSAAEISRALVDGILAPVRWREVQQRLETLGVTHVVEVGPGGVLAGLARRALPRLEVLAVAGPDDLAAVADLAGVATARR